MDKKSQKVFDDAVDEFMETVGTKEISKADYVEGLEDAVEVLRSAHAAAKEELEQDLEGMEDKE